MHYFVYETRNNVNGKTYVGVHSTQNIDDGYLGSGKYLRSAIKKYGKDNFSRTILHEFECIEDAFLKESEIVDLDFVKRSDTYNMVVGGSSASILKNRKAFTGIHSSNTKAKISKSKMGQTHTEETKQKQRMNSWYETHPEERASHVQNIAMNAWANRTQEEKENVGNKIGSSLTRYFKEHGSSNTGLKRLQVVCPHCGKHGANNTMSRWHFDNCKQKYS